MKGCLILFIFIMLDFNMLYTQAKMKKKNTGKLIFITLIFYFNYFDNVGLLLFCPTMHYLPNHCNDSRKPHVILTCWDKVHCQPLTSAFSRLRNLEIDWIVSNNLPFLTVKLFKSSIWHISVSRASQLWCCALDFYCIHWQCFIQKCLILSITIKTVNSHKHSKSASLKKVIPCFLLWLKIFNLWRIECRCIPLLKY